MARPIELELHQFMAHLQDLLECEDLRCVERKTGITYKVLRDWAFHDGFNKTAFENVDKMAAALAKTATPYSHAQIRDGFAGLFKPWLESIPA